MLKGFAKLLFAVVLILVSAGLIIQMKYSISFNEYLAYSQPLTREEQQFLKEKKSLTYGIVAENAPFTSKNKQVTTKDLPSTTLILYRKSSIYRFMKKWSRQAMSRRLCAKSKSILRSFFPLQKAAAVMSRHSRFISSITFS